MRLLWTCWPGFRVKNSSITDDFQRNGFVRRISHRYVEIQSHCSKWRFLPLTLLTIFVLLSTPLSTAYSGLAWAGAAQTDSVSGKTVTFSPSGDMVASGHSATVLLSNSTTHESIQTLYVDFFVQSIAFTSDEKFLIVGAPANNILNCSIQNKKNGTLIKINTNKYFNFLQQTYLVERSITNY